MIVEAWLKEIEQNSPHVLVSGTVGGWAAPLRVSGTLLMDI